MGLISDGRAGAGRGRGALHLLGQPYQAVKSGGDVIL